MGIEVASSFTRKSPVPLDDSTVVADLTARDAIAAGIRYEGMTVYVESEETNYQLVGGVDNSDWTEFSGSGGGGIGSALTWKPVPGTEPILVEEQFYRAYEFDPGYGQQKLCATFSVPDSYRVGTKISIKVPVFVYSDLYSEDFTFKLTSYCNQFSILTGPSYNESTATLLPSPVTTLGDVYWLDLDVTDSLGRIDFTPVLPGHNIKLVLERDAAYTVEYFDRVMVLNEMIRMVM